MTGDCGSGDGEAPIVQPQPDTIFITGLDESVTQQQLLKHFGTVGSIKSDRITGGPRIFIYKNKVSGRPKGEATVTYADQQAAKSAIACFNNETFNGRKLKVETATRKLWTGEGDHGGRGHGGKVVDRVVRRAVGCGGGGACCGCGCGRGGSGCGRSGAGCGGGGAGGQNSEAALPNQIPHPDSPPMAGTKDPRQNYKFPHNMQKPKQMATWAVPIQGQEPMTASFLACAPLRQQKQMLGERLFPIIQIVYPDIAGKITGMLLEMDNADLLHMLESRMSLLYKVEEAIAVLQAHHNKIAMLRNGKLQQMVTWPGPVQGQEPVTASLLARAPLQEQKQILGDRLFPIIQIVYPDIAGKITGMLLEIDNADLMHMLESRMSLLHKMEEAVAVLEAHQTKEPLTASLLACTTLQEQKQMLGERLFAVIQSMYPDIAGKITGMLLEMDNSDLLQMLENRESINANVEEAVTVLKAYQAEEAASRRPVGKL